MKFKIERADNHDAANLAEVYPIVKKFGHEQKRVTQKYCKGQTAYKACINYIHLYSLEELMELEREVTKELRNNDCYGGGIIIEDDTITIYDDYLE